MLPLEERMKDRQRRRALADRETSPATQTIRPQDRVEYGDMKVPELRDLLRDRGASPPSSLKKDELIEALEAMDKAQGADQSEPADPDNGGIPQVPSNLGTPWNQN